MKVMRVRVGGGRILAAVAGSEIVVLIWAWIGRSGLGGKKG
jgi:hypothetical protein